MGDLARWMKDVPAPIDSLDLFVAAAAIDTNKDEQLSLEYHVCFIEAGKFKIFAYSGPN